TISSPVALGAANTTHLFTVAAGGAGGIALNVTGVLSVASNLIKVGPGVMQYATTANTYSGITAVNEGTLRLQNTTAAGGIVGGLVIGDFNSVGAVTGVTLTSGGLGYTANLVNQAFTFVGGLAPNGVAATGTYSTNGAGTVTNITITSAGSGYLTAPT